MATTGFWPIHGNLKKLLDYADNPVKTVDRKYLDDDLYDAIQYAGRDDKTDEQKYVSGINCSAVNAYDEMVFVKRKFGERGKVTAYHGFQSFKTDELTPEQAHAIGIETARRMWGDGFQVLVTTHLNTDNLHNHFVVNSVSFRDGKKYRNSIEQHHDLREISDAICREHGLSVLENAPFSREQSRGAYWYEKSGKSSHREQLKADMEYCLKYASNWEQFVDQLSAKGYSIDPVRMSVKADGWQRAVRLDRLGFPDEMIYERLDQNAADPDFRFRYQKPTISTKGVLIRVIQEQENYRIARLSRSEYLRELSQPSKQDRSPAEQLLDHLIYEANHTRDAAVLLVDAVFALLIALAELVSHYANEVILTADLRHELKHYAQLCDDHRFLKENRLHSMSDIDKDIAATEKQIASLADQREKVRNQIRHETDPMILAGNKKERAAITDRITPLRQRVKRLRRIQKDAPRLLNLLKTELQAEHELKQQLKEPQHKKNRSYGMER